MKLPQILNRLKHVVLVLLGILILIVGVLMFLAIIPASPVWWILTGTSLLKKYENFLYETLRKTLFR